MAPGLGGGSATHMRVGPRSILHKSSTRIAAPIAVMFNPLAAGIRWAVQMPGTTIGDKILILGPGQRGLASVIAARGAWAAPIPVTGLAPGRGKPSTPPRVCCTHPSGSYPQEPVAGGP